MIKKFTKTGVVLLVIVSATVFWLVYGVGTKTATEDTAAGQVSHSHGTDNENPQEKKRKIKYWVAPMDPNYIRHEPGKSPMGMDLVPVYEDEDEKSSEGVISIDPVTVQNIGVRTAPVSRGWLHKSIRTVGRITYDEKNVEHIHTKVSGWVEELYVDTTGEEVRRGQELLSLYSPELVATQEEYLQALTYRDRTSASEFAEVAEGGMSLVEAAGKRLLFMDIDPGQIEALEKSREVQKDMKLHSSKTGIVINKNVVEGMKVDPAMELYTIADLSRVWVIASVYEYEIPFIENGLEAEMTLSYDPGAKYSGRVTFVYPYLSDRTRTVQVRMEFNNPGMKLKPDMYADVVIKAKPAGPAILVPSEAVIRTGSRTVVVTSLGKGKFLPREVSPGLEGDGLVQILDGLKEDETVVTSGQFLIDSESNLREAVNKMLEVRAQSTEYRTQTEDDKARNTETGTRTAKEQVSGTHTHMTNKQKHIMSGLIDHYLKIHAALVSESVPDVAEEARIMSGELGKIRASDADGQLKETIVPIEDALKGLLSGSNLKEARNAFKALSRSMAGFVKGPGREDALSSGIKLYYCPMEEEWWMQKGTDLRNPYLGKDMWLCGTEEKF
jgi:RND family efflux transporter MFP subunit